jgi:ribonuclease Z
MKINVLGTAGASVTKDRDNTSFLIDLDGCLILLDCSGNPAGKILRMGYQPNDLDLVLITHLHIDHCYGLPALLFHMFLDNRTRSIDIAAPEEEFESLLEQLKAHQLHPDIRSFAFQNIRVNRALHSLIWSSDFCRVFSMEADHNRSSRSYRVEELKTGRVAVFSGDSRPSPQMPEFARHADLLVHEASYLSSDKDLAADYGHSTAVDAAKLAVASGVSQLALVHFDLKKHSSIDEFRKEASSVFSGKLLLPDDFDVIQL